MTGDTLPRDAVVVQPWTLLLCHLLGTLNSDARKGQLSVKQQMNSSCYKMMCNKYDVNKLTFKILSYWICQSSSGSNPATITQAGDYARGMGSWRQNHHSCHKGNHPYCKANSVSQAFIAGPIAHQVRINTRESYHLPAYWLWWNQGCQCLGGYSC